MAKSMLELRNCYVDLERRTVIRRTLPVMERPKEGRQGRTQWSDMSERLSPKLCTLLRCLSVSAGEVVSYEKIGETLWKDKAPNHPETLRNNIQQAVRRLRSKIGDPLRPKDPLPRHIEQVRHEGYRFLPYRPDPHEESASRLSWGERGPAELLVTMSYRVLLLGCMPEIATGPLEDQLVTMLLGLDIGGRSLDLQRFETSGAPTDDLEAFRSLMRSVDMILVWDMPANHYVIGFAEGAFVERPLLFLCPGGSSRPPLIDANRRTLFVEPNEAGLRKLVDKLIPLFESSARGDRERPLRGTRTLRYYERRDFTDDGRIICTIERRMRVERALFYVTDSMRFGNRPAIDLLRFAEPEVEGLDPDTSFELRVSSYRTDQISWRIIFDPPLEDHGRIVTIRYGYETLNTMSHTGEEVRARAAATPAHRRNMHTGFCRFTRWSWRWVDELVMEALLPQGVELDQGPELLVVNEGRRLVDHESSLASGLSQSTRDGRPLLRLQCKPPVTAWYHLRWVPS